VESREELIVLLHLDDDAGTEDDIYIYTQIYMYIKIY